MSILGEKHFVVVSGDKLAAALKLCISLIETRNTYPILGMVRLEVRAGALTLSATDLDILLTIPLAAVDSIGDWAICLPARPLETVARIGREGNIRIEGVAAARGDKDPQHATILLDQGDLFESVSYELEGLAVDSFPDLEGKRAALIESFGNGRFGELIAKVSWATSFEETRYYLNGVAWEIGPKGRRVMATDGHRLAVCKYDPVGGDHAITRVLPNKLIALLARVAGNDLALYGMLTKDGATAPHRIEIVCPDGVIIRSKLIELPDSGYPDIDRVTPKRDTFRAALTVGADAALAALDRVMAFVSRRSGKVVSFTTSTDGSLMLKANNPDTGSAQVVLPVAWPSTAEAFGINGTYLKSVLRHCRGQVTLHQVNASAPLTILDEDETTTRLLMPMRV